MRVAINNRGEVAVRIIRTCQELGFTSILLHSSPDKNTIAYRMADETVELTGSSSLETYLNIPVVVNSALSAKAELLHPGFGFLSENAEFVVALESAGITFVGPSAKSIFTAGNKIKAKELAKANNVPVTPAYTGSETDPAKLLAEVRKIGFPCIVKAASGGGGKGMKVVEHDSDFFELLSSAQREAKNAFGSDQVFIERYIQKPRHIEVQILCDTRGKRLHFFERECSIQRRHQKIFEETPSTAITPELRDKITAAALKIAEAADYTNAGTVEFLLDEKNNFYFMELNTRLQVEHTVTELVCGVDLVRLQFAIALGHELEIEQTDISQRGHALEVRIYAENPALEFLPSPGTIQELHLPLGPHRRFDFGYDVGDTITPNYDPMIGKIITWAPTREENLRRMYSTLCETVIFGVHTNIEFLKSVLLNKKYQMNNVSTRFLEEEYKGSFKLSELTETQKEFAKTAAQKSTTSTGNQNGSDLSNNSGLRYQSPWVTS
ncbi:MAG: biotin carboxylase N-terminal domain-containing protein [Oligoflexia bacterium]|nr:biotin carboxylase N-terminal domain-containing protein [Oligoflexia bacterium]